MNNIAGTLHGLIRDALRYRELRKHVNRGFPMPGVPYVCGWDRDDNGTIGDPCYIREGELDAAMDDAFDASDVWATLDAIGDELAPTIPDLQDQPIEYTVDQLRVAIIQVLPYTAIQFASGELSEAKALTMCATPLLLGKGDPLSADSRRIILSAMNDLYTAGYFVNAVRER